MATTARPLQPTTSAGQHELSRSERSERTAALVDELSRTTDPDGAEALRGELVLVNRGVAESVAARYKLRGVARDDLNQVAYEGLTKAVNRFDAALGNDLLTFAVPTIRGELQRYFRDQGWMIRPPRRIQETQSRAGHATEDLEHSLGREPSDQEVATRLEISVEEYRDSMAATGCFHPTSLDQPTSTEQGTIGDLLVEPEGHDPSDARVMLAPVLRRLSARDRRILYLRYFEDLTQGQIGEDIGVTQMQVSRLLTRILGTVKRELGAA